MLLAIKYPLEMSEKILGTLKKLGLNNYESKAYLALVSGGVCTASKVAESSGIPRAKVYEVLRSLEKQGFTISTSTRPSKFKPVGLDGIAFKLQNKAEKEFKSRIEQISKIHDELEKNLVSVKSTAASDEEMVWILRGRDNIYNAIDELVDESHKKIVAATTEKGIIRKLFRHKDKLKKASCRGVDVRLLAPITQANAEVVAGALEDFLIGHGGEATARFVLADDDKGILILHGDDSEGPGQHAEIGLMIKSPYFIRALGHYFEKKWDGSEKAHERLGKLKCEK